MSEDKQINLITPESGAGLAPVYEQLESADKYTAARLRKQRPDLCTATEALINSGMGLQDIASALGLHFYSVQALAAEMPDAVAVGKKQVARLAGNVGRRAFEKINEFLDTCTITTAQQAQQMATVAGIALDKQQVLDGEPSEIVQHNAPGLTDMAGLMTQFLPAPLERVSAGGNSAAKEGGEMVEDSRVMMAVPGGALIAASRRVTAAKAELKAAEDLQSVDCQANGEANPLSDNQADDGSRSVAGGGGLGDDDDDAAAAPVPQSDRGRGGVGDSADSDIYNASD